MDNQTRPFLYLVAADLYKNFGNSLNRVAAVFPNRRASLFLNNYLASIAGKPIWAPRSFTIGELFSALSRSKADIADPIEAVCRLYSVYAATQSADDTIDLDSFFGWGEKILKDFDDIDKNLVDAPSLLRNLQGIRQIESRQFVSEEQERIIREFFGNFNASESDEIKKRFLNIWNNLLDIYNMFRDNLRHDGLAYEGMLFRQVVTDLPDIDLKKQLPRYDCFAIIGFNLLSNVEKKLFKELKDRGVARFYWDYDEYYTASDRDNEAGTFIKQNMKSFGSQLPATCFKNFARPKEITIVSAQTDTSQANFVSDWLAKEKTPDESQTGIVVCDERLFLPVVHALPDCVNEVNVTKGFPMGHTPVFSAVAELCHSSIAERNERSRTEQAEWLDMVAGKIRLLAAKHESSPRAGFSERNESVLEQLYAESEFQAYQLVMRLRRLIDANAPLLNVSFPTLCSLLLHLMRQTSIPFHGEPARGVQLMGVLETRNIDFSHLIVLSASEGVMPPPLQISSFIPVDLRRAFGMTVPEHETGIYSYYFHRMIQRASHITFTYNASAQATGSTGEMSRFLLQLIVESGQKARRISLQSPIDIRTDQIGKVETIAKDKRIMRLLDKPFLSPSAINCWLNCELSFFYKYVANIKEPNPDEGVIQPNQIGSIFHNVAQKFYEKLTKKQHAAIDKHMLEPYIKDTYKLKPLISAAFHDESVAENVLVESVILQFMHTLLKNDCQLEQFEMLEQESEHLFETEIETCEGKKTLKIGGRIDRIDRVKAPDGHTAVRVVDYKTGGKPETVYVDLNKAGKKRSNPSHLDKVFLPSDTRAKYSLQVFLYSIALSRDKAYSSERIAPALFFLNHAENEKFSPYISYGDDKHQLLDIGEIKDEYLERLRTTASRIFNLDEPFTANTGKNCAYCAYKELCGNTDISRSY